MDNSYTFKSEKGVLDKIDFTSILRIEDPPHVKGANQQNKYYGRDNLVLLPEQYYPFPSLTPTDKLESLFIQDAEERKHLEIYYSKEQNLYYLKNTSAKQIVTKISFIIDTTKPPNVKDRSKMPSDTNATKDQQTVAELVTYCSSFGVAKEDIKDNDGKPLSGEALFKELYKQKVGACRHRSEVFFWQIEKQKKEGNLSPDVKARIIKNDLHEFVEIQYSPTGPWEMVDLGGYSVSEQIIQMDQGDLKTIDNSQAEAKKKKKKRKHKKAFPILKNLHCLKL